MSTPPPASKNSISVKLTLGATLIMAMGLYGIIKWYNGHHPLPPSSNTVLTFEDAWIKPVKKGASTAAYGVLVNHTDSPIELTTLAVNNCLMAEFHTHIEDHGVMKMRQVPKITVPPQGSFVLQPGKDHLMCLGAHRPMKEGDIQDITLATAQGRGFPFRVPVRQNSGHPGAKSPCGCHKHKHTT